MFSHNHYSKKLQFIQDVNFLRSKYETDYTYYVNNFRNIYLIFLFVAHVESPLCFAGGRRTGDCRHRSSHGQGWPVLSRYRPGSFLFKRQFLRMEIHHLAPNFCVCRGGRWSLVPAGTGCAHTLPTRWRPAPGMAATIPNRLELIRPPEPAGAAKPHNFLAFSLENPEFLKFFVIVVLNRIFYLLSIKYVHPDYNYKSIFIIL